ncbi:4'-phosphopantetheinyl transferase superfamily protein [Hahella sp. CR1]|uniref:4'-phosphopantetheinyl transferase family protein n=1 Tax=Hahella sp. CR1 TaxID=2992807 RepID=UPI00244201C5|nr:4'-phosphopantetheinyl transferase superfamily protein [Hahella sp. CR1]MDG9670143.1 4'-phosphopantetheinyl transferase superfamily protein [Hahella sp. CR1]
MDDRVLSDSTDLYIKHLSERKIPGFPGVCFQCEFSVDRYSDDMVSHLLGTDLPDSMDRAVAKRRAEFVAGRYVARRALMALGATDLSVGIGENRAPVWPESFTGSISHAQDMAICAVADGDRVKSVGIDVENMLSEKVAADIVGSILTDAEHGFVGSAERPDPKALTLIFSAKESLFKALYVEVGYYFGFEAAKMLTIDWRSGMFRLELLQTLTDALPSGSQFEGRFEIDAQRALTVIVRGHG